MKMRCVSLAFTFTAVLVSCSSAPPGPSLEAVNGDPIEIAAMEGEIADIMEMADVPGLSVAIINDSQVVYTRTRSA